MGLGTYSIKHPLYESSQLVLPSSIIQAAAVADRNKSRAYGLYTNKMSRFSQVKEWSVRSETWISSAQLATIKSVVESRINE